VTSLPEGIACGAICQANFYGDPEALTAAADGTSVFGAEAAAAVRHRHLRAHGDRAGDRHRGLQPRQSASGRAGPAGDDGGRHASPVTLVATDPESNPLTYQVLTVLARSCQRDRA
jgi:hypothetical protein